MLDGALEDDEGRYAAGSWLRNPPDSQHAPFSLDGCLPYVKIGHLACGRTVATLSSVGEERLVSGEPIDLAGAG